MGALVFSIGLVALVFSFNALWPRYRPPTLAAMSFFAGWLTSELAPHFTVLNLVIVGLLARRGALQSPLGQVGLVLDTIGLVLLALGWRRSLAAGGVVEEALTGLPAFDADRGGELQQLFMPIPVRDRRVERTRDVVYFSDGGLRLRLDVFRSRAGHHGAGAKRPIVLYVHGGAWIIGNKEYQGLPLLKRMAARGWVGFSINYRLSPRATFPDQIVDVKRAIVWVREHAEEYGGDPDFIVIAGGSAGGHLASLAALTPDKSEWQPGFEAADTSVAACLSFYGVYDFSDRFGHWPSAGLRSLLERYVMKAKLEEARPRFEEASPLAHVGPHAPPFLVVHGESDSVVPVAEARVFVKALAAAGAARCAYIELPGAQHAFEIFPSVRTLRMLRGVERFLKHVQSEHTAGVTARWPSAPDDGLHAAPVEP